MKFKEEKNLERIDTEDIKGVKNKVNPDEEDAGDDFSDDESESSNEEDSDEKSLKNAEQSNIIPKNNEEIAVIEIKKILNGWEFDK